MTETGIRLMHLTFHNLFWIISLGGFDDIDKFTHLIFIINILCAILNFLKRKEQGLQFLSFLYRFVKLEKGTSESQNRKTEK